MSYGLGEINDAGEKLEDFKCTAFVVEFFTLKKVAQYVLIPNLE